jgi:hypothetical protein
MRLSFEKSKQLQGRASKVLPLGVNSISAIGVRESRLMFKSTRGIPVGCGR